MRFAASRIVVPAGASIGWPSIVSDMGATGISIIKFLLRGQHPNGRFGGRMSSKNLSFPLRSRDKVARLERKQGSFGACTPPQTPTAQVLCEMDVSMPFVQSNHCLAVR